MEQYLYSSLIWCKKKLNNDLNLITLLINIFNDDDNIDGEFCLL